MNKIKRFFLFFFVSLFLIIFDQWTKHLAVAFLKGGAEITLLPRVLYLLYVENPGAAFGILRGQQFFFLLITIVVLLGILYTVWKIPSSFHSGQAEMEKSRSYFPLFWALCFVFSGAIGNCIDRQLRAYVVDFIYFSPIDFPVFNVADIYVSVSAFLLLLLFMFYYKETDFSFVKRK
jgi:signal peptidase II